MIQTGEFKNIQVDSTIITDEWNLTPFLADISITVHSNSHSSVTTGNLHPPIVRKVDRAEVQYELLSGHERFRSFRSCFPDENHITALVLPADVSFDDILQYLLSDKLVSSKFSFMEKAIFLKLCSRQNSLEKITTNILPLLGEKPQLYLCEKLLSLTTLEPSIQQSIHSGQLSHKLSYELLALSAKDRTHLHDLFQQLELGGGKQKRLLTLCKDLAFRKNKNIVSILAGEEYSTILNHAEMNEPQKGASLLNLLYKQLFPESIKAEDGFRKRVLRMELPANCTVQHSKAFERNEVSLTVVFKDMEQLEQQFYKMKEILS
jgi:ParB family transcriptional regulator, chromosome partitioning protein